MTGSSPDDSSVVETPVVTSPDTSTQTTTPATDTVAASSTTDTKPAETILDRVKSTLAKTQGTSQSPETPGAKADADASSTAKPDADSDELPADEAKTLHPKTKERFGKLTSDLKTARTEIEKLKPQAAEYDKIDTFIRNAGLSPQDVGSTLQIAAMLRSEPAKARERLRPIMAELDRILGETLPTDLQTRVDQGLLTEEDAKALNRASADARLARQQADSLREQQTQEQTSRSQQQAVDATLNAIDGWEKAQAKGDPDWHQKQQEVSELVELAITRKSNELKTNWWPTPEEAIQLSKDALAKVGDRFKRFTPKPRAIDPPVTAGASPRSTPAPKNTMDIIKGVVSRAQ